MTLTVIIAVVIAAITHASWNAIAHHIKDQLLSFTLISGGGLLIGALAAPFVPFPAPAAWPFLIGSAALHVTYMLLLMRSFTLGDFGQMYPIARGTAPLVVTVLAALFVHETPDVWVLAGVAVSCAGLVGVALWGLKGSRPHWPAIAAALATGLAIASYTTVDGVGVRDSGSSLGYIAWLMILEGISIPVYAAYRRRARLLTQLRPYAARGLAGAAMSVVAYGLVLWAQTRAPLAPIAALRESSIIVGAAIGAVAFKERFGRPRIAAAGLMVVGIGLMLHAG
ncbi:EamA family transporter [Streptomyces sp. NPDC051322]|uniref:EamA family transporter n=1 Tax=Streptomyces sp. NPDC051322 TaxID=3154645 RepID=UPI00344E6706